ncbi:hypothetical protein [Streptomyces himalayensis]|uniref:Uncharacterized protein n=1 Tax=Streptomyces himalayensis subsp. himalayensis TaxID=2756131 RepID=A0A7W0I8J5_9ACTN|nr:hypothetical protein [Streptomyces himalayensis]MBA2946054.1 hypothetical protein [Streptomyces himalayensis subsp. himalayensis]
MTASLIALALLALLVCGLEPSHRRRPHPRPRLYGSADGEDRDAVRVRDEIRTAADRSSGAAADGGSGARADGGSGARAGGGSGAAADGGSGAGADGSSGATADRSPRAGADCSPTGGADRSPGAAGDVGSDTAADAGPKQHVRPTGLEARRVTRHPRPRLRRRAAAMPPEG